MSFPFTAHIESGTQFLAIDEIPLVTAFARYPARDDETHEYAIERQLLRIEYEGAVSRAIEAGTITPLNPFSLERHAFPHGNALKTAVITLEDYKRFAASLQIQVEIKKNSHTTATIKTIAETAELLSAYLNIDEVPDGESSPEFRLSIARTFHIPMLKEKLLQLVSDGAIKARTTAGTSIDLPLSPTESTLIEVGEAKAELEADNPFGSIFEEENEQPPINSCPMAIATQLAKVIDTELTAAELSEYITNNSFINWNYWVLKMPVLTAAQAARLMAGLDPDVFESLDSRPNKNNCEPLCSRAKSMERSAIAQQIASQSPSKWLEWADAHPFLVHDAFRMAVQSIDETSQEDGTSLPPNDLPNQFGYTIRGAAIAIAREYEVPEQAMRDHIFKAAEKGELAVIDPQTGMPYTPEVRRDFYERIRIDDLDKWFETCGVPYRLGELSDTSKSRASPIDEERDDASVLKRHRELHSQCKAPTKKLAEELGISDTRVRQIIRRAKKAESAASKTIYSLAGQLNSITARKR